jgi:hypothetical protein
MAVAIPAVVATGAAPAAALPDPSISASPTTFGSGSFITVTGSGFTGGSSLNVWFDQNNNSVLDSGETSVAATVASDGTFSTKVMAQAQPGSYFMDAGPDVNAAATTPVDIGSCWIQDCFITHSDGSKADTICLVGNSPTDLFSFLSDCKTVDEDYTNVPTGYDFTNQGPTFPGAGALAAMTNDLVPGLGCIPIQAAIATASGLGENVPDGGLDLEKPLTDLTDIACGSPGDPDPTHFSLPQPPLDLAAYTAIEAIKGNTIPDVGVLFAVIGAIQTAAAVVVPVLTTAGVVGALAGQLAVPIIAAALSGTVDPATAFTIASSVGAAISLLSAAVIASAVLLPPAILAAAATAVAQAAVAVDIACGYVDYFCHGRDLTANILGNAAVQQQEIPISFAQPPFVGPASPNACRSAVGAPQLNGTCYGQIIGWAQVACTTYPDVSPGSNSCEKPGTGGDYAQLPIPGSAGDNNVAAPTKCATGNVVGMSIGYDGDIAFDVNDSADPSVAGPGIAPLVNYHNFEPGPGGSDPPDGIDVEIPYKTADSPAFMPKLALIRKGVRVHVCGQWVSDMHMLWNELHPASSLSLLIDATGTSLSGTEGSPLSGTVATYTDPNPSDVATQFSATIDWGDGSTSSGSISGSSGSFTVTGDHTYSEEGTSIPVKVTITDADDPNDTATANSTADIADAALSASGLSFNSTNPVNAVVATFTDADPAGTTTDYNASIDWGDASTPSSGTIGSAGGEFTVTGTHTYSALGPYTLSIHICDIGGSCADATSQVLTFAYADGGSFALGDAAVGPISSAIGKSTFFWGAHWNTNNPLSTGSAPPSFKGFEDGLTPPACGVQWTGDPGKNASEPATIPTYMAVLVAGTITKHGTTITGDEPNIVIVKTNPGYGPQLNTPGTGTIVGVLC